MRPGTHRRQTPIDHAGGVIATLWHIMRALCLGGLRNSPRTRNAGFQRRGARRMVSRAPGTPCGAVAVTPIRQLAISWSDGQVKQYVPTRVGTFPSHAPAARSRSSSETSKKTGPSSTLWKSDLLMAPYPRLILFSVNRSLRLGQLATPAETEALVGDELLAALAPPD
jgi:hypothetical protein